LIQVKKAIEIYGQVGGMDLLSCLQMNSRHIAAGERILARQREIVAALEEGGHDTTEARKLLEQFEELQVMHISDGERLKKELRSGARTRVVALASP
jgi:hypothetical protein